MNALRTSDEKRPRGAQAIRNGWSNGPIWVKLPIVLALISRIRSIPRQRLCRSSSFFSK